MIWAEVYSPDAAPPGATLIPSLGADWYGKWDTPANVALWCSGGSGRVRGSTYERSDLNLPDYALDAAIAILDATSVQALTDDELRRLSWAVLTTSFSEARVTVLRQEIVRRGLHNG